MKKKIFDRRGAGIELAILMMVVSFSMSILLTSVALIQSTKKVRAEERLQQSIALEQLGQDFLSAVLKGDVENWTQSLNNKNNHTGHTEQATVHQWGDWKDATEATCTEAGTQTRKCTVCEIDETKVKDALGHSYDDGVITTPATCKTEGVRTYTCTNDGCTDSYTEKIPVSKLHSCNGKTISVDKTEMFICAHCDYTSENNADFAHNSEQVIIKDATCIEKGEKAFTCDTCNDYFTEEIAKLDHNYDDGVITTPATCKTEGVRTFTCTHGDCNESYTEKLSILQVHSCKKEVDELGVEVCAICKQACTKEFPAGDHTWDDNGKCTVCDETKPFEGKWDDAYELIVYKNGDSFDVYVTITASNDEACEPEDANLEVVAYDGDAEIAEPAGKQVLVIHVEKVENAENEFTYKITEWTKNDRS